MTVAALVTVGWVALPIVAAPVPKALKAARQAELAKLQGTWVLVSREEGGQLTVHRDDATTFVVTGEKWEWKYGDAVIQHGTFTLSGISDHPKRCELAANNGAVGYSIYEIDGDDFQYCSTGTPKTRPTEFNTKKGGYCCVWKRAKK
jgi:uncharacterized protein (TIGR03067 family)